MDRSKQSIITALQNNYRCVYGVMPVDDELELALTFALLTLKEIGSNGGIYGHQAVALQSLFVEAGDLVDVSATASEIAEQ